MARSISRACGVAFEEGATRLKYPRDLTTYIEQEILPKVAEPLVFGFDEVDRILGRSYQSDFFYMLRTWHQNRGRDFLGENWKNVSLALVISTEPYLLISRADRSPFNVSVPIVLSSFSEESCARLNAMYQTQLTAVQLGELYDLLRGHPYLTRLAFYRLIVRDGISYAELIRRAADPDGPFGDHLRALLIKLYELPELLPAMRRLIKSSEQPAQEIRDRLSGAGLVRYDGAKVVVANLLYARFFQNVL
jgi:hypothetical protein